MPNDNRNVAGQRLSSKILGVLLLFAIFTTGLSVSATAPAGGLGLEEYKKGATVDVNVSQSRLFKITDRIIRTSIGDPAIAVPVVLCENQFVVLGVTPGATTLGLWDDAGGVICMNVLVKKTSSEIAGTARDRSALVGAFVIKESRTSDSVGNQIRQYVSSKRSSNDLTKNKTANPNTKRPTEPGYLLNILDSSPRGVHLKLGSRAEFEKAVVNIPKTTQTLDVTVRQARMFKTRNRITKAILISPLIAEPIIVSDRELVIVGKAPGQAKLVLQDEKNNLETIELNCEHINSKSDAADAAGNKRTIPIPYTPSKSIKLTEQKITRAVALQVAQPKCFITGHEIVRASMSDEGIAEMLMTESREMSLLGIAPGKTTLFLWDDTGNSIGIDLLVSGQSPATSGSSTLSGPSRTSPEEQARHSSKAPLDRTNGLEYEYWTGSKKDVLLVPHSQPAKLGE